MKIKLQPQIGAAYEELTIDKPVTVRELADRYQPELPYRVLLANVDGKDEELTFLLHRDCSVRLLDMRTYSANLVYQHSLSLIYLKAVMDVLGDMAVEIEESSAAEVQHLWKKQKQPASPRNRSRRWKAGCMNWWKRIFLSCGKCIPERKL